MSTYVQTTTMVSNRQSMHHHRPQRSARSSPNSYSLSHIPSPTTPRSKTPDQMMSELAALPSLSRSLNNLSTLGLQDEPSISVYEGMPSKAQAKSHEKLKLALAASVPPKTPLSSDKTTFYSSHCPTKLTMTPAIPSQRAYTLTHNNGSQTQIMHQRSSSRQKFHIETDAEDCDDENY